MQSVLLPRYHPLDIFNFAKDRLGRGERIVLIVIEAVSGASVRPVGTPMVVSERGEYAGYVSNGCVDADIAGHALQALEDGKLRRVKYGAGSPYIDIRLPCGGSVSVVILPDPNVDMLHTICERFDARENLKLSFDQGLSIGEGISYAPPLRIVVAGRGENLLMFTRTALSLGIDGLAYTPDAADVDKIRAMGGQAELLTLAKVPDWKLDARTALVTLFHDHDYEIALLKSALESRAFYIGAMGSLTTHQARLKALRELSDSVDLSRLRGPIGLVPSMRDAGRLAVSVLAEIIAQERSPF